MNCRPATVSVCFAPVFFVTATLADDFSTAELASGYSEAASSIKTLYVEYDEVYTRADGQKSSQRCVFARDGEKWHYSTRPVSGAGASIEETVTCSDGEEAFLYYLASGSEDEVDFGTIEISEDREEPMVGPEFAIGLKIPELSRLSGAKGSLLDLINATSPTTVKPHPELGAGGLSILPISVDAGTLQIDYQLSVNIDPDHGFLPTSYRLEFSEQTKQKHPSHRDWALMWETSAFERIDDRMSGGERWFPSASKFTQFSGQSEDGKSQVTTYELSVQTALINDDLDPSLFNPRIPTGTTVVDATSSGKGRVSLHGGSQAVDARARQLAEMSNRPGGNGYTSWLAGINLLVILTAVVYFFFARSRSTE